MKRWLGHLLAVGLGLGLVAAAELGLHLVPGLAPAPLTLQLAQVEAERLVTVNPDYAKRFFGRSLGGQALQGVRMTAQPFITPPADSTFRVVFAGGSTVQGYPYPRRLAAASYLEAMLQDAWPRRQVEVFNLGITAVSSFVVARSVEDALTRLRPDLVVVYTGHNEFYGVYGAAALSQGGERPWTKKLYYGLMQRRLSRLIGYLLPTAAPGDGSGRSKSMLEIMGQSGQVAADDPRRRLAADNLEANLRDIAAACHSRQVPLVLCTLASNESGFAPAGGDDDLSGSIEVLLAEGRLQTALGRLDSALAADFGRAAWHFLRARCLEGLGQAEAAGQAYRRARDLDPQPWRAPSTLSGKVRHVAAEEGVWLADVEADFAQAAAPAGVGWGLMADHLHPNGAGQRLLARSVAATLVGRPGRAGLDTAAYKRLGDDEAYRARQVDLPLEGLLVRRSMAALLGEPPMDRGDRAHIAQLLAEGQQIWRGLSVAERQGFERWSRGQGQELMVLAVADRLFAAGDYARARSYYRAARLERPFTVWGDLWAVLRWGRCLELEGGLDEEARRQVQEAVRRAAFLARAPATDAAFMAFFRGYAHHLLGDGDAAIGQLQAAAEDAGIRRTFFFDLTHLLCGRLAAAGRWQEAEDYARRLSAAGGQAALGRRVMAELRKKQAAGSL